MKAAISVLVMAGLGSTFAADQAVDIRTNKAARFTTVSGAKLVLGLRGAIRIPKTNKASRNQIARQPGGKGRVLIGPRSNTHDSSSQVRFVMTR